MFGSSGSNDRGTGGVLADRRAVPESRHPRVTEPTAGSVVAGLGASAHAAVDTDATVLDALREMATADTGAVAVVGPSGLVGIFSERDHARTPLLGNRTPADTPLTEALAAPPAVVAPTDGLAHCLALLRERRATHLAVVEAGRLVGLLSEGDLLAATVAWRERIAHETELDQRLLFLRGTYSC